VEIMRGAVSVSTIAAFTLTLWAGIATAVELRVLTPGGAATGVKALAIEFAKQTGTQVTVTAIQPYIVREKVLAGEPFDVVVQATPAMTETERAGLLRPGSRVGLARGGLGVTVRAGGAVPDVSTVESFKRSLLAANKVVVGELTQADGAGPLILRVLEAAGILEAIRPKFQVENIVPGNELIARGGADIGLFNMTAIPYSVGVALAGAVPAPLQVYTEYDGGVLAKAVAPDAARAFVRFMASENGRKGWMATGFEMLPAR
jgi:molybdate transport system substrate-binding protein